MTTVLHIKIDYRGPRFHDAQDYDDFRRFGSPPGHHMAYINVGTLDPDPDRRGIEIPKGKETVHILYPELLLLPRKQLEAVLERDVFSKNIPDLHIYTTSDDVVYLAAHLHAMHVLCPDSGDLTTAPDYYPIQSDLPGSLTTASGDVRGLGEYLSHFDVTRYLS